MRRWHRSLAPIAAVLLLVIALTGLGIQTFKLLPQAKGEADRAPAAATAMLATAANGEGAPRCAPPPRKQGGWSRTIKRIHSGEQFGPVGTALNLLAGALLTFLSSSGLWMYCDMALRRRRGRARRALAA
jgi:uncharacterized iron-regulated membrane protein